MDKIKNLLTKKIIAAMFLFFGVATTGWYVVECTLNNPAYSSNTGSLEHKHAATSAHQQSTHNHENDSHSHNHSHSPSSQDCCSDNPILIGGMDVYVPQQVSAAVPLYLASKAMLSYLHTQGIIHHYENSPPKRISLLFSYFAHAPPFIS